MEEQNNENNERGQKDYSSDYITPLIVGTNYYEYYFIV